MYGVCSWSLIFANQQGNHVGIAPEKTPYYLELQRDITAVWHPKVLDECG